MKFFIEKLWCNMIEFFNGFKISMLFILLFLFIINWYLLNEVLILDIQYMYNLNDYDSYNVILISNYRN